MKPTLIYTLLATVAIIACGCTSNGDSRAEQDNHRQSIKVAGRPERASGDVGQPR